MKGIILAGGKGTRLYPITRGVCKQLLPIYDKPMIYYPLSVLMMAGIRDILIISTPNDTPRFRDLLGSGRDLGMRFAYAAQKEPRGIAESFIIGEKFIGSDNVCLILGDNIFYGDKLSESLKEAARLSRGAHIFGYYVRDPERYGVIESDASGTVRRIVEKPKTPRSNWAVAGLYFYDNDVVRITRGLKPSPRGELEISDVNNEYIRRNLMKIQYLGRGFAWLDTGTYDSLIEASLFIKTIEDRQGLKIGCIEEIAFRTGAISRQQLVKLSKSLPARYGEYLQDLAKEK
jgi:glucose-1-phosphate thymidylyltransferase